jgi:hypothetical protein
MIASAQDAFDLVLLESPGQSSQPPPRHRGHAAGKVTLEQSLGVHVAQERSQLRNHLLGLTYARPARLAQHEARDVSRLEPLPPQPVRPRLSGDESPRKATVAANRLNGEPALPSEMVGVLAYEHVDRCLRWRRRRLCGTELAQIPQDRLDGMRLDELLAALRCAVN